jgi:hypothetical protein
MPEEAIGIDMPRLIERVHAAARRIRSKSIQFRRLETRTRAQCVADRAGWTIPLVNGSDSLFGVELVPCTEDDEGAVAIHHNHDTAQLRLDAQVLWDLWAESLPDRTDNAEASYA